jgi:hypothetical protein
MTATTAVPSYQRLARLTPYLLAVGLAMLAWLLLGTHAVFAAERTGSGSHRPNRAEATERAPHHAHATTPKENRGLSGVPAVHAGQPATVAAPAGHPRSSGQTQHGAPIAPAQPRHVEQRARSGQPPVAGAFPQTAPGATTRHPAEEEEPSPVKAAVPPPKPVRAAELHSVGSQHRVLAASVQPWSPAHEEQQESSSADAPKTVRSFSSPAAQTIAPQPATQRAGAARSAPSAGCAPLAHVSFHKAVGARNAAPAQGVPETGTPATAASAPADLPPLTLVAEPSLPAAPEPQGPAPVAAAGPPAVSPPPPVTNPVPLPGLTSPSRGDALDGSPLVARLQSALTLIALALLVALLAIVLLVQLRLMRFMRSLRAAPEAEEPAKRYYSLSHEEVRELAPDLAVALTHHRFCESERHQGRHRLASWLELEQDSTELPLMWSTCETCHHQRITKLQTGREVAAAHN